MAAGNRWNWTVDLDYNPDKIVAETDRIIVSSDSVILDRCQRWFNLVRRLIENRIPQARLIDVGPIIGQ